MKKIILLAFAAVAAICLPACSSVDEDEHVHQTTTTTTESTAVHTAPVEATTTTVRQSAY